MTIAYGLSYGLKSNLGKMLLSFGIFFISYTLGQYIYSYYNIFLHVDIPYPSWADAAYVIDCPFGILGFFYLVKIYQSFVNKRLVMTSLATGVIASIVIFGFIVKPDLSAGIPLMQKFLNLYYPITDVIAVVLAAIALQIGGGKLHHSLYILALAYFFSMIADLLYTYRSTAGIYWVGDIADLFYTLLGYLLVVGLIEIINNMQQSEVQAEKPNEIQ
jgi:hypothetical protein